MKVLFVNESTNIKGGIDTVVAMEMEGLSNAGIDVDLSEFSHSELLNGTGVEKLKKAYFYFSESKKLKIIKNKINSFNPDIVHFHNTYPFFRKPLWSDSFFEKIKVIQHLHNYYPFCLNSFFFIDKKICTKCYDNNSFSFGVKNSCYDYSKAKSLLVAQNRLTPKQWLNDSKNVDLFLGVSKFLVDKYIEFGVEPRKIKKLYNGIVFNQESNTNILGDYVLFLGNIVHSKGVQIVCELASRNSDIEYRIAGIGRDLEYLKKKYDYLPNLTFEGYVIGQKKKDLIRNSRFLIFPVQNWESFGLVILEAISYDKHIIISGKGGTSELIENCRMGFVVEKNEISYYEKAHRNLWDNLVHSKSDIKKTREFIFQFSIETHIKNLINYYQSIV